MPNKQLIIDGEQATEQWVYIGDDAPLTDAPNIISLDRLEAEAETLKQRNTPLGVILSGGSKAGDDPHRAAPFLDMLSIVAIEFPVYRNGRGFSAARVLREQYNYTGELRAVGDVLYDQWQFMSRCGINAFEIAADISLADFNKGINALPNAYQPTSTDTRGILWARHKK